MPEANDDPPPEAPPPSPTASAQLSTVDIWSARLAAWAQVITVGVVIFGYFYTVKPAFQLQLLQEQTAQLQLDEQAAQRKLDTTLGKQIKAETDLANVNGELVALAKRLDYLEAQLR